MLLTITENELLACVLRDEYVKKGVDYDDCEIFIECLKIHLKECGYSILLVRYPFNTSSKVDDGTFKYCMGRFFLQSSNTKKAEVYINRLKHSCPEIDNML